MAKSREGAPKSNKPTGEQAPKILKGEKGRNDIYEPVLGGYADGTTMQSLENFTEAHKIHESEAMSEDPAKFVEDKLIAKETIKKALAALPEREAKIVSLRYGLEGEDPKTLVEIGEILGLSRDRIRQLEERALLRIRRIATRKLGFDEFAHKENENLQPGWAAPKLKTDILGDAIPTKPYLPKSKKE